MKNLRRGSSVIATVSLVLAGLVGIHAPASAEVQPVAPPGTTRIAGSSRYLTSVAISKRSTTAPQDRVYITSGANFADALAVGPVAGFDRDPILLTRPDSMPDAVTAELQRLNPSEIVILGSTVAVNAAVENQIRKAVPSSDVRRIGGRNRWETSAMVALTRGDAPIAAATAEPSKAPTANAPTTDSQFQSETENDAPASDLQSPDAATDVTTDEPSGADTTATEGKTPATEAQPSTDVVPEAKPAAEPQVDGEPQLVPPEPVTGREVVIANGLKFPDALVAGSAMASKGGTILLTDRDTLPAPTVDALKKLAPSSVTIVGGEVAVSAAVNAQIKAAVPGVPVNRIAGSSRYQTAEMISTKYFGAAPANVVVASGENFPDALSGTPLAAANKAPILLTTSKQLPVISQPKVKSAQSVVVLGGAGVASMSLTPPAPPKPAPAPAPAPKPKPITGSYGTLIPNLEYVAVRATPIRLTASSTGRVLANVSSYELMKTTSTAYNYSNGQKWWKVRFQGVTGYVNFADITAAGRQPLMVYGTLRSGQAAGHVFNGYSHTRAMGTVPRLELWMTKNHSIYTWWPWALPGSRGLVGEALYFTSSNYKSAIAQADTWEGVNPVGNPRYQNYMRDMEFTARGNKVWVYVATDWREAQARQIGVRVPSGDYTRF